MTHTLAIDIGGTKILAALVADSHIVDRRHIATDRNAGADAWVLSIADLTRDWLPQITRIGVTVTGAVTNGLWSALNPGTLNIPPNYPLADRIKATLGLRPTLFNDAQAAAWGEYRFGAGQGQDLVFLTVSTGIGGGAVVNGRLAIGASGFAGNFGQTRLDDGTLLEERASGRWIGAEAQRLGQGSTAPQVFAAAESGADWANDILNASSARVARLCANIQMMLDPALIVIGGGVGLAPGYLPRVTRHLADTPDRFRPNIARAALQGDAGVLGIAALANTDLETGG